MRNWHWHCVRIRKYNTTVIHIHTHTNGESDVYCLVSTLTHTIAKLRTKELHRCSDAHTEISLYKIRHTTTQCLSVCVCLYVWVKKGVLLGEMGTDILMFDGSVKTEQAIKYND